MLLRSQGYIVVSVVHLCIMVRNLRYYIFNIRPIGIRQWEVKTDGHRIFLPLGCVDVVRCASWVCNGWTALEHWSVPSHWVFTWTAVNAWAPGSKSCRGHAQWAARIQFRSCIKLVLCLAEGRTTLRLACEASTDLTEGYAPHTGSSRFESGPGDLPDVSSYIHWEALGKFSNSAFRAGHCRVLLPFSSPDSLLLSLQLKKTALNKLRNNSWGFWEPGIFMILLPFRYT